MKSRYGFHLMCYIRSNIFISSLKGGQVDSYDTSCTICIVLLSPPSFKETDSATGSAIFPKSVVSQRQHLTDKALSCWTLVKKIQFSALASNW